MRKALCSVVLLALVSPAFAANNFAGTWKLNTQKSTGPEPATVEQLVTVDDGDGQITTVSGKTPDGHPFMTKFSFTSKGGEGKIVETTDPTPPTGVTAKPSTATAQDLTFTTKGKPTTHVHCVLSKDDKTMTCTVRAMSAGGTKPEIHKDVFEKQ